MELPNKVTNHEESAVAMLEMIERHGYYKLAELIDGNHIEEASKLTDILKAVGII